VQVSSEMQPVINALAEKFSLDFTRPGNYVSLALPHHDQLVIEVIAHRRIAVAHYFEQNGDLIPDPSMTFFVTDAGQWAPIGITQVIGGSRSYVKLTADGGDVDHCHDPAGQADAAAFADTWARNIAALGWLARATCQHCYLRPGTWPEPTTAEPAQETLMEWAVLDGDCEATDGCHVEPDGVCPHGHPSWLIRLGLF
jgi:hypothetical protein